MPPPAGPCILRPTSFLSALAHPLTVACSHTSLAPRAHVSKRATRQAGTPAVEAARLLSPPGRSLLQPNSQRGPLASAGRRQLFFARKPRAACSAPLSLPSAALLPAAWRSLRCARGASALSRQGQVPAEAVRGPPGRERRQKGRGRRGKAGAPARPSRCGPPAARRRGLSVPHLALPVPLAPPLPGRRRGGEGPRLPYPSLPGPLLQSRKRQPSSPVRGRPRGEAPPGQAGEAGRAPDPLHASCSG